MKTKLGQGFEAVTMGTCRCCHDSGELLNDDHRCSSCWDVGVMEEWQVETDEGEEDDMPPALVPA